MARRLGVCARIVPACDAAVRTTVRTPGGRLPFQHYFVRDRCEPVVTGFDFEGAGGRAPVWGRRWRRSPILSLRCVVVCPSNPFISIDPILAVPGMRDAIRAAAPVIGVSPIVGGPRGEGSPPRR